MAGEMSVCSRTPVFLHRSERRSELIVHAMRKGACEFLLPSCP
jgi:hypothetical protein